MDVERRFRINVRLEERTQTLFTYYLIHAEGVCKNPADAIPHLISCWIHRCEEYIFLLVSMAYAMVSKPQLEDVLDWPPVVEMTAMKKAS